MKFCFVMPFHIIQSRGGGSEIQAWFLAKELARRGHVVHYICQSIIPEKIGSEDIIEGVVVTWLKLSGSFQWIDSHKYYEALNGINPDVVIQRLSSCVTNTIGKYCLKKKKTFVWICTDNAAPRKWHFILKQIAVNKQQHVPNIKKIVFLINAIINNFLRNKGIKKTTIIFSQNTVQKRLIHHNFKRNSSRMISAHPAPKFIGNIKDKFNLKTVIWVANLGRHKQPELFIKLAKTNENNFDIKFIMVGGHSNEEYVNDLLDNKPLNLTYTGKLDFENALEYFNKASLFVNTSSSFGDGFPNTYIQAWLRKVPVLTLNIDPDNIIKENEIGFVCKDITSMSDKIHEIFSDYPKYSIIAENAYEFAMKYHSIDVMADNFLSNIGA